MGFKTVELIDLFFKNLLYLNVYNKIVSLLAVFNLAQASHC